MNLHKIGVKLPARESGGGVDLVGLIPVFHRWIQGGTLDGILIDVADYSHMHHGPGVLIIAHDGNYGYDETKGRRGMVYYAKHPQDGDLAERLGTSTRRALQAARQLAAEQALGAELAFPGEELEFFANDRLAAPNTEQTFQALEPALRALLDRLYPQGYELAREPDPRERFSVRVKALAAADPDTLLERLDA
ncbi:hypothetical protein [Alkalilimnicola sp. S0819]|uniref:hypothetical protein n=1 Tax=Alkalilimnicola sp. S0819 TaxID=2613922 RepID=UPI001261E1B9|nr:hypothetical protein [Alkalilimnicola sp. S0819]KAB7623951.1 hypothetical protein F3N43_07860 [Alkalilimnicola sp. S0819]MPQ16551.1 hypothetical protein [Alkalilimnicola sp. S0819]